MHRSALVVDDSKSARFAMRKFLEGFGYVVESADCAEAALASLEAKLPEIMFLDHVMPGIDGFEALRRIRAEPRLAALPVILCSSTNDEPFLRQARVYGAHEVLHKPPSREQLHDILERLAATPKPAPPKVQPIRDPEIAIEQAVMKTLREALPEVQAWVPPPAAPSPPSPETVPVAVSARPDPDIGSGAGTDLRTELRALREETEARMRRMSVELFAQIGELRAQILHAGETWLRNPQAARQVQGLVEEALHEQLGAVSRQVDEIAARLRAQFEEALAAQDRRLEQLAETLRVSVVEEAHTVADRVVLNAANRISAQVADSLLKVLKPQPRQSAGWLFRKS